MPPHPPSPPLPSGERGERGGRCPPAPMGATLRSPPYPMGSVHLRRIPHTLGGEGGRKGGAAPLPRWGQRFARPHTPWDLYIYGGFPTLSGERGEKGGALPPPSPDGGNATLAPIPYGICTFTADSPHSRGRGGRKGGADSGPDSLVLLRILTYLLQSAREFRAVFMNIHDFSEKLFAYREIFVIINVCD